MITTIAFDADDTLWHNERIFLDTKEKLKSLLAKYHDENWIEQRLDETESRNISHFGYGIKAFTLSMIETACELSEGRITGLEIQQILNFSREMLASPIEILEGVKETIHELSPQYRLILITKGDLFDQEAKLARSGLGIYFDVVEIVVKKDVETYEKLFAKHQIETNEVVMVGNSLRSDILPVVELGGKAVYIPYETEWFHEKVTEEELQGKEFITIKQFAELKDIIWEK